mgnify:CR=1 FL=1
MTAFEFKIAWSEYDGELRPISLETLLRFNLSNETREFLNTSGLPDEAAPFLSFVGDINLKNKYDSINILTNWFDFLPTEYSKYVVIGTDGSGDVIALNTEEGGVIEWLDHEDGFSSRFMNSSILHLASCLIAYNQFIKVIRKENGDDAYIEANFNDTQFENLYKSQKSTDEYSLNKGNFWQTDLDSLIAQRDNNI